MIRCDALIVGGGPAGLAAAIALRQKNLDVLVIDALSPPIDKACGEGLMPDSREALGKMGIAFGPEDGHAFHGISFLTPGIRAVASFEGPAGVGIRRLRLHELLTGRCRHLGVRLQWATSVALDSAQPVRIRGERCQYRYLIGADGQSSRVRAWAGLERGRVLSKRFGARCHFRVPAWTRTVEVYWGVAGQAYVTAVAPEEVCVATVSRSASARMDAVLAELPELWQRLKGAPRVNAMRGAVTTTRRLCRVTAGNVALVGDASGSADAITGEGLTLAFREAVLLGEAIDAGDLRIYQAGHPGILRVPQIMSRVLLWMDRCPGLRRRAMAALAEDPQIFQRMLKTHLAEERLSTFLLRNSASLGWRLLRSLAAAQVQ